MQTQPNKSESAPEPEGEGAVRSSAVLGEACAATPRTELLRQLLDSRVAKNEREWAGAREIERLRGIIARNARTRLSGTELYITPEDIKDSLEILYAEQERGDSPNEKLTDSRP